MVKRILIFVSILLLMSISFIICPKSVNAENNITIGWSDYATVNQVGDFMAQQGYVLKIVNISIANNGYSSFSTNPTYFSVTSAKSGNIFNYTTYIQNEWVTWDVYNGMTFYGSLVFQMPLADNEISAMDHTTTIAGQNYNILYASFVPYTSLATPTSSPDQTPIISTIIQATSNDGEIVTCGMRGNIEETQISNANITTDPSKASTTISFTLTGQSASTGFGNITIIKNSIPYGTTPTIYVDNQKCPEQGYTQDDDLYYVWFTVHFSTHKIAIVFAADSQAPTSTVPELFWLVILPLLLFVLAVAVIVRHRKTANLNI
jgi:hypothetical protein